MTNHSALERVLEHEVVFCFGMLERGESYTLARSYEAIDACLEYWMMRHGVSYGRFGEGDGFHEKFHWDSVKGWLCDCID